MDYLSCLSVVLFQNTFKDQYLSESLEVQLPVVESHSEDVIVSLPHAVAPFGMVGVNLYLADLIEDVISYGQPAQNANKNEFNYAFLDRKGITIAHPAFPRPMAQQHTPFPVHKGFLENSTDFAYTRQRILHDDSGNLTTSVYLTRDRKIEIFEGIYHWQSILGIYILCLVSTYKLVAASNNTAKATTADNAIRTGNLQQVSSNIQLSLQPFTTPKNNMPSFQHNDYEYVSSMDLLYHRLDLVPPPNGQACRYFRQVATMDAPTLFLSASAFVSPFTFLHNNRVNSPHSQIRTVESIMVYLKDTTGLLANPGLRPQIKQEVSALYNAMQHLKKRHQMVVEP